MYIEKEIKWNSSEQNGRPTSQELIMYRRSDRTRGERKTYSEQQVKATDGKIVNWLTGEIGNWRENQETKTIECINNVGK